MAPRPAPETWTYLLDHALDQEIGIAFIISGVSRESFRTVLYKTRKLDPRYDALVLFSPAAPHDNEIWICHKGVEMD